MSMLVSKLVSKLVSRLVSMLGSTLESTLESALDRVLVSWFSSYIMESAWYRQHHKNQNMASHSILHQ